MKAPRDRIKSFLYSILLCRNFPEKYSPQKIFNVLKVNRNLQDTTTFYIHKNMEPSRLRGEIRKEVDEDKAYFFVMGILNLEEIQKYLRDNEIYSWDLQLINKSNLYTSIEECLGFAATSFNKVNITSLSWVCNYLNGKLKEEYEPTEAPYAFERAAKDFNEAIKNSKILSLVSNLIKKVYNLNFQNSPSQI